MANIFQKTGSFLRQVVPGRELARGLGTLFSLPEVTRQQSFLDKRDIDFQDFLIKEFNSTTDSKKKETLRMSMKDFKFNNVLAETMEDTPSNRQIAASAGELGLFAALGLKGKGTGLRSLSLGKAARVTGVATKLTKAGKALKYGKEVLRESAIGAGFFGLMEASEKETDPDKVIKAMETGALVGGGVYVGAGLLGVGIRAIGKKVITPLSKKAGKIYQGIEKVATAQPVVRGKTQIEKTLSLVGDTTKVKAAKAVVSAQRLLSKTKMRLLDRFDPIKRMENKIIAETGTPLKEYQKLYRDARLIASASDAQAEKIVNRYYQNVKQYGGVSKQAKAYMVQLDLIDRAKLGQKVAGNQSLKQLFIGLRNIVKEIGPDDMKAVIKYKNTTNSFHIGLIQSRVDAGLISRQTADRLLRTHPNYIPHNVLLGVDEKASIALGQSLNVPKTDLMKAIGSVKKIQDPLATIERRTQIAVRTMNKNTLLNNLVKTQEKTGVVTGMKKLTSGQGVAKNFESISFFKNGVKETWQVPSDLGIAIKNLDVPLSPKWLEVATTPQKILKKFATQYNLSFALPNKFRDKQTAYLTAGSYIDDISKRYGLMKNPMNISKLTKSQIDDLYNVSGGYGSSIFKEGESKIISGLEKKGVVKMLSSSSPAKVINNINEAVERSTRMGVFKQAIIKGLNPKDAALVARDASIDFAKMGTWMQPVNKAVPFLNARVQGFVNLPRAFVNSPETFARMQLYTSVYPTMLLHQHNRRFESYKNIANYYKTKYWVIMTGETETRDPYSGKPTTIPQFITIPKGEGQALVSGPIQYYLEKSDGVDFRKTSEMIADVVGSASPMEFQTFDQGNKWLSLAAQFGPGVSIPAGLASGKDPYFGTSIIPPSKEDIKPGLQYKSTTPELIKDIGMKLDISPAQIEFAINSFGGLSKDVLNVADTLYGVVRDNKIGGNPITDTPFGAFTQLPITRRFLRETTEYRAPEAEHRREQKKEIETEVKTKSVLEKERAIEILEEMNKKETKDEKANYLNSLGLSQDMINRISDIKKSRQTVEALKKTDDIETRARYIQMRLDEIEQAGGSKEDKMEFLRELESNKILTKSVKEMIMILQEKKL